MIVEQLCCILSKLNKNLQLFRILIILFKNRVKLLLD